jgi:hypothetical protein
MIDGRSCDPDVAECLQSLLWYEQYYVFEDMVLYLQILRFSFFFSSFKIDA